MLRSALITEFAEVVNSTYVHEKLRARKKKPTENYKDYLIAITGLAKSIHLEEAAIIEYAIRGIDDDERNKVVLYSAKNLAEFKIQLNTYERMRSATKEKELSRTKGVFSARTTGEAMTPVSVSSPIPKSETSGATKNNLKCHNCNAEGHFSRHCPDRS